MRRKNRKLGALPKFPGFKFKFSRATVEDENWGETGVVNLRKLTVSTPAGDWVGHFSVDMCHPGEYAPVYVANIAPAFRGKGLYPVMLTKMRDRLKKEGCAGIVSLAELRTGDDSSASWKKFAAREPRVRVDGTDDDFYFNGLGAMTSNAELDKFKFRITKKQDGHKLSVYDGKKLIGVVGAITRGCDLPGFESHADVVAAEILPEYRGKKLYQEMLLRLRQHVKGMGCKGLRSRGFQRSSMADRAWRKLAPRIESDKIHPTESRYENLFLDGLGKMLDPAEGYRVEVKPEGAGVYSVRALSPTGEVVGEVGFGPATANPKKLEAGEVFVEPRHRRKGLATAMYAAVEKVARRKVIPSWVQSSDGKALWEGSGGKHFGALPTRGRIRLATAKQALKKLPAKYQSCGITPALLREGMEVEREHRDVTKGRVGDTAKTAAVHICEHGRSYYPALKKLERKLKR